MADKKRKTLQIKRPDVNSVKSKKKPLPKVQMDEKAATSSVDTDNLASMGPQSVKSDGTHENSLGKKNSTTRISLPDEDKIRKARRANATQDLGDEDALPSAEQIAQAQKNATMPIMIDTETVEDNSKQSLDDTGEKDSMDRTMEIDADALSTSNLSNELSEADQSEDQQSDQTMQIDPAALATGNLEGALEEANADKSQNDQTLQIDSDSLEEATQTQNVDLGEDERDQTMMIDPEALTTGNVDEVKNDEIMSMETMQMDPQEMQEELEVDKSSEDAESDLTLEEMKESFNAQTMEMDASQLDAELAKKNSAKMDSEEDSDLSKTMDLSESRPKTIMIKRPSKKAPSSASTPTVKAVRPDAATVRTSRPVTANTAQPKQDTSRIDVPDDTATSSKEGKTIKLRRPAGGPSRSSTASRVAGNAGLTMNADGTVTANAKESEQLGAAWLAVAVLTFLISAAAVWSLAAQIKPDLPMPGRLVDLNNQIVESSTL